MEPRRLALPEFVAMMAVIFAMLALSIDAMLPAFPQIARELTPGEPNRVQMLLTLFMVGMGVGTLIAGPLSDSLGRLPVITGGIAIYIAGAALAYFAPTLETMVAARILQGLGAAAPRVVSLAMIRDLHEGRRMAQITSFIMTVFMLVPAAAPSIGQLVIDAFGWRALFPGFILFAVFGALWLNLRQDETLDPRRRRRFTFGQLGLGAREVLGNRQVMIYVTAVTLGFGQMFALLTSSQQIYDSFGRAATFPLWFMLTAAIGALGTIVNASLVMRLGMRRMALAAFLVLAGLSTLLVLALLSGLVPARWQFWLFLPWSVTVFFMGGLTFGNLNALALQPLGHIAGLAASVVAAISTIFAMAIAAPIGMAFDGTPLPVLLGTMVCSWICLLLLRRTAEPRMAAGE